MGFKKTREYVIRREIRSRVGEPLECQLDQTAASHPGNWPVLISLAEAVGFASITPQRLMVMPDDPATATSSFGCGSST